jgi:uncharacterized protein with ParB-like and HNH nuclease domain
MEATKSTLHNILNSYYQIPSYQRLYSWEQEHQEELLNIKRNHHHRQS